MFKERSKNKILFFWQAIFWLSCIRQEAHSYSYATSAGTAQAENSRQKMGFYFWTVPKERNFNKVYFDLGIRKQ